MTLKYLSEEIFAERAGGYGFDFGVQADLVGEAVSLGATLRNVGRMSDLNAVATELPRALRAGVEFRPFRVLTVDDESLLDVVAAVDVSYLIPDERTQYHFGLEAEILGVLDVRGGAISNDTVRQFSGGVGFQYGAFVFDYALVTFESGFGGPGHILTVGYAW